MSWNDSDLTPPITPGLGAMSTFSSQLSVQTNQALTQEPAAGEDRSGEVRAVAAAAREVLAELQTRLGTLAGRQLQLEV